MSKKHNEISYSLTTPLAIKKNSLSHYQKSSGHCISAMSLINNNIKTNLMSKNQKEDENSMHF